jgi:hypothetical protein
VELVLLQVVTCAVQTYLLLTDRLFAAPVLPLSQSIKVLNMVKLYGKAIRINKASQDKTNSGDVGANLFIGNLDPDVDEKVGVWWLGRWGGCVRVCVVLVWMSVALCGLAENSPTEQAH